MNSCLERMIQSTIIAKQPGYTLGEIWAMLEEAGQTSGDSQPQQGYRPVERIWTWNCDNDKCWRSKREIRIPAGNIPKPCRGCGGENFVKTGEKSRVK